MLIAEIFESIQGEGELVGMPSVFIRASGCNLRCVWCDTPYASWDPQGDRLSVEEVAAKVLKLRSRHVVITGGEPMIALGIHELAARLRDAGRHITIETAATIPPQSIACDLASLSPKLRNSAPEASLHAEWRRRHELLRIQPDVIRAWVDSYAYQLKFVVTRPDELDEIEDLLRALEREIPCEKVLLMPEGIRADSLHERGLWLAEICTERGYRFCPRLQIDLFANARGK